MPELLTGIPEFTPEFTDASRSLVPSWLMALLWNGCDCFFHARFENF